MKSVEKCLRCVNHISNGAPFNCPYVGSRTCPNFKKIPDKVFNAKVRKAMAEEEERQYKASLEKLNIEAKKKLGEL